MIFARIAALERMRTFIGDHCCLSRTEANAVLDYVKNLERLVPASSEPPTIGHEKEDAATPADVPPSPHIARDAAIEAPSQAGDGSLDASLRAADIEAAFATTCYVEGCTDPVEPEILRIHVVTPDGLRPTKVVRACKTHGDILKMMAL